MIEGLVLSHQISIIYTGSIFICITSMFRYRFVVDTLTLYISKNLHFYVLFLTFIRLTLRIYNLEFVADNQHFF